MTSQHKHLKKRKLRDEKNKKARLIREKISTQKRQETAAENLKLKRVRKFQRDMGRLNMWSEDVLMKLNDSTLTQLEKNVKVLKALEEEYETERNRKRELNDELESKGLRTLEEKMSALHNQLVEDQKAAAQSVLNKTDMGVSGAAGVKFSPNKPRKDVAEVEVIRAPVNSEEITSECAVSTEE